MTTSANVERSRRHALLAVVNDEDADSNDGLRGVLVVREEVVAACRNIDAARLSTGDDSARWTYLMKSIAACEKSGKVGALVLHGPTRPQVIVKYAFSRLGVPEYRVETTEAPGQLACAEDDCAQADLRVEVGLARGVALAP